MQEESNPQYDFEVPVRAKPFESEKKLKKAFLDKYVEALAAQGVLDKDDFDLTVTFRITRRGKYTVSVAREVVNFVTEQEMEDIYKVVELIKEH